MRTPLASKQTTRARIRDLLCGAHVRTADLLAYIAAQVAADGLSTIDPATFGLFNNAAGSDNLSITAGSAVATDPDGPWTAADVGKPIHVAGAAVGGAVLVSVIHSFQSATQVTLSDAAGVTIAAASNSAGGLAIWGVPAVLADVDGPLWQDVGPLRAAGPLVQRPSGLVWASTARTVIDTGTYTDIMAAGVGVRYIADVRPGTIFRLRAHGQLAATVAGSADLRWQFFGGDTGAVSIPIPTLASQYFAIEVDVTIHKWHPTLGELAYLTSLICGQTGSAPTTNATQSGYANGYYMTPGSPVSGKSRLTSGVGTSSLTLNSVVVERLN